jgi:hypothetical protein
MVSHSQCSGSAFVSVDAKATASFSATAIVSFMDCSSLYGFFDLMDISFQLLNAFLLSHHCFDTQLIGYELRDGFGSDVRWDIDNKLQLGLEMNHKWIQLGLDINHKRHTPTSLSDFINNQMVFK